MSERSRNGKPFAQDATGFFFILVGGFFAVSIVLFLRGQEPRAGLIGALTWPVVELVAWLGSAGALLFSAGLAALGTLLFLRSTPFPALRPLTALVLCSLGVALVAGAFGGGGALGAWLPALVTGFGGRALVVVLGAALAWLGWSLLPAAPQSRTSSAEAVQRIGLAARHDAAAGVSPAEAALLTSEPRASTARPAARREEPVRDEIRPFTPGQELRAPRPKRAEGASASAKPLEPADPIPTTSPSAASVSVLTPPAPSWERARAEAQEPEAEEEQDGAEVEDLIAAASIREQAPIGELEEGGLEEEDETEPLEILAESFELEIQASAETEGTDDEDEVEEEERAGELDEPAQGREREPEPAKRPVPSWEQIGLFDEEEELEEELQPAKPVAELTPSFDFESSAPIRPAHEPEVELQPGPARPARAPAGAAGRMMDMDARTDDASTDEDGTEQGEEEEDAEVPADPAAQADFLLKPAPVPISRPEPAAARDEQGEHWPQLVFEAGCVILEQKRVAVSMLERRFGIDFEQACRVLDELQQAGLIGPYMGGRTRDILLSREEWLPHAPHAS